jgi:hypothetical protein
LGEVRIGGGRERDPKKEEKIKREEEMGPKCIW